MAITIEQQQTIDGILARMRADGWTDARLDVRALADEAAEFGTFDENEVEAAGKGAIVVFCDGEPDPDGNTFEVPDRGLVIAADGRIATAARDENARDLHFEEFEQGYWQALLWADGPTGNTLMPENVDPDAAKSVRDELRAFVAAHADDLAEYLARVPTAGDGTSPDMQAGGDLALTRNGHGSGFWDHAPILGAAAARLADGARALGPVRVTVGEDDRVTISPA